MLSLKLFTANVKDDPRETLTEFLAHPPDGYKCVMRPALELQAQLLQVPVSSTDRRSSESFTSARRYDVSLGEVVTDGRNVISVTVRERLRPPRIRTNADGSIAPVPGSGRAERSVWVQCVSPDVDPNLDTLIQGISERLNVTFEPYYYKSERFEELRSEGRECPGQPSPLEVMGARTLSDRATRTLATAIKASGGLMLSDLKRQLPREEQERVDQIRELLTSQELASNELLVICKKSSTQVLRLPSSDTLADLDRSGVKCACGRRILDERIEKALSLTEFGRRLLDGSRWFTILLIDELVALGVATQQLLVEQNEGGDEMDCLADISGELVFFELKDKEFNLGNAYSFGAKIGIVRPDHSVIITTEKVGGDARDHFQRAQIAENRGFRTYDYSDPRPRPLVYIEGLETLRNDLTQFVTSIVKKDAASILSEAIESIVLDPREVVEAIEGRPEFKA